MSELYVCENAGRCSRNGICKHAKPHMFQQDFGYLCGEECNKGVFGSKCVPVAIANCSHSENVYAQSSEEREACDMARAMIEKCANRVPNFPYCDACMSFPSCPARVYLAAKHQADAWEVK